MGHAGAKQNWEFFKEGHWLLVPKTNTMKHIPVLQDEIIKLLAPQPNENFIDLTLGHGGHSALILEKTSPKGQLLAVEQDLTAIKKAKENLAGFSSRLTIMDGNFTQIGLMIRKWSVKKVDGIIIDLGPNTGQLLDEERGFSFRTDAPLDMRMDVTRQRVTAADILNKYSQQEIAQVLFDGEERFAKPIAKQIINKRPIYTANELVEIIKNAMPPSYRYGQKTHFATATFRALRMAVNDELKNLKSVLPQAVSILSPGGRLAVISFHSLEDRIVKNFLRENVELEVLTAKPVTATEEEVEFNPSARSAKLRGARKI